MDYLSVLEDSFQVIKRLKHKEINQLIVFYYSTLNLLQLFP